MLFGVSVRWLIIDPLSPCGKWTVGGLLQVIVFFLGEIGCRSACSESYSFGHIGVETAGRGLGTLETFGELRVRWNEECIHIKVE